MDSNFTINLKKQSRGKKKRRINVFGDTDEIKDENSNRLNLNSSQIKKKKIKLTEITAEDLVQNKEKTASKKPALVIKLDDDQSYSTQEMTTLEEYNSVPVELFGEALLRGMGWDGEIVDANENTNGKKKLQTDMTKLKHPENVGIGATKSAINIDTSNFMPIKKVKKKDDTV